MVFFWGKEKRPAQQCAQDGADTMERMTGIEPARSAWKATHPGGFCPWPSWRFRGYRRQVTTMVTPLLRVTLRGERIDRRLGLLDGQLAGVGVDA